MEVQSLLSHKFEKNFGRDDMFLCVPIMWTELSRLKSRVETVINTLSAKAVQNEKIIEFKKQLVSNKSLKNYFAENPEEKEILLNDISHNTNRRDRYLFRNLDVMPSYVIPHSIMAQTQEQIAQCVVGVNSIMAAGKVNHNRSLDRFGHLYVEQDNPCKVVQNLVGYPAAVERYKNKATGEVFDKEDPTVLDHHKLEPTSGRKIWKLRHNKRITKTIKADKSGFIGSS
jgi:hypothetical protein